jgi:UDP-2,3-diacylglucosamine pyrophosphatase LpxH
LPTTPQRFDSIQEDVFVVSDLHIASGRDARGVYEGTENFFADQAFGRFLEQATKNVKGNKALLVINGDTFDFLRVTQFPGKVIRRRLSKRMGNFFYKKIPDPLIEPSAADTVAEFIYWHEALRKVGIHKTIGDLQQCISNREQTYGLETDDYKSIYKLMKIREGHPLFFKALGDWMQKGHRLLIIKGNHDLELFWYPVRNYLRLLIAESIQATSLLSLLKDTVLPNLCFADDSVLIDNTLYLEHGHRYDKFAMVLGGPTLRSLPTQINIPFGSFFNRYLINRVELYYPYLDKVRPTGNIVPILVRDNFPLALKIFGSQLPFAIRMLMTNVRYVWFMIRRVVPLLLCLIPIVVYLWLVIEPHLTSDIALYDQIPATIKTLLKALGSVGSLVLSYFLARIIGWLQLVEPSSLAGYAQRLYEKTGNAYRIMSMGHTHNPGAYPNGMGGLFYNTGTWIPVIETATAEVREDKTYTFLHLIRDAEGRLTPVPEQLQRWNDDAGRSDPQLLIRSL